MNLSCVICGELFTSSSDVQITPCGHMYHTNCILQWFERSKTCPQCRNKCLRSSIHKVFFNIANLDTSQIDIGSLQQELDNNILKNNVCEKKLEKSEEEIKNLRKIQKNCMKTISGLEDKLKENTFIIQSYNEQFKIFKNNSHIVDEQHKEIKELKYKIELMSSMDTILKSTTKDVEKLVKECKNKESLASWIVTLKRELRACENKRTDLRNTLKVVQHNANKDNITKKLLIEKISELESENYHLNKKIKEIMNDSSNNTSEFLEAKINNSPKLINSPIKTLNKQNDKVKKQSTNTINNNNNNNNNNNTPTLIMKNLKKIEESTSPYLNIKSSSIGLSPLLKKSNFNFVNKDNDDNQCEFDSKSISGGSKGTLKKTTSDLSDKYTIFKKPRLGTNLLTTRNDNLVSNGFGGSERKLDENYTLNIKKNQNLKNLYKKY